MATLRDMCAIRAAPVDINAGQNRGEGRTGGGSAIAGNWPTISPWAGTKERTKKPRTGAELGCGARWGRAVGWGAILVRRRSNPTCARIVPNKTAA